MIPSTIHFIFNLVLALAALGVVTSLVAQHMYALPPYAFMAQDFTTQAALYTHHQYIAGFIMTGAFAHGAIFFIRDYNPEQNRDNVLARMLEHKEAIISHLSWASLFLGFHTLGLYVHNDVMLAFGTPEKQILIDLYLLNGYNLHTGKLCMVLMYFYRQQIVQLLMLVKRYGYRVGWMLLITIVIRYF